jgi:hypothetical protein
MNPTARKDDILTEQLFDETLVYDLRIHKAHRLNRAAGAIWARCDGHTSVADMAAALPALGLPADTGLVEYALGRLEQAQLLEQPAAAAPGRPRMSRRVLLRRLAQAGALGAALPVVSSIIAPTPAMAASRPCVALGDELEPGGPNCCPGLEAGHSSSGVPICEPIGSASPSPSPKPDNP